MNIIEKRLTIRGLEGTYVLEHNTIKNVFHKQKWISDTIVLDGKTCKIHIRFDDECNNGHNSFSIIASGTVFSTCKVENHTDMFNGITKFHLCNSKAPLYYIENTKYHIQTNNREYARSTAIWQDATDEDLSLDGLDERLNLRLPALMNEFKGMLDSIGFLYL